MAWVLNTWIKPKTTIVDISSLPCDIFAMEFYFLVKKIHCQNYIKRLYNLLELNKFD